MSSNPMVKIDTLVKAMLNQHSTEYTLTVKQAAFVLELHRQTVWVLIKTKKLQAKKNGRDWMIKPQDLRDLIIKREMAAKEESR